MAAPLATTLTQDISIRSITKMQNVEIRSFLVRQLPDGALQSAYNLSSFQSAYDLDLPITLHLSIPYRIVSGRVMGISREGGKNMHIIKIQNILGQIENVCVRCVF